MHFDFCIAASLCAQVGYGNVAGFLFHKGIMNSPSAANTYNLTTPSGEHINPITGTIDEEIEPSVMTDEEKEQEAEKLFVLFDRLEKTGAIQATQNPIRKAIQEGRVSM
jgi:Guanine nucleotide exchange factor synembryn